MASIKTILAWAAMAATSLSGFALAQGPSIPLDYCATINTATMGANISHWQTEGLCHDFCNQKKFAFAVIAGEECYCSNFVPDSSLRVATSECQKECPGYPTDFCGSDGHFVYLRLDASPSGTIKPQNSNTKTTATTANPTSTETTSSAAPTTPIIQTVTAGGTVQTVTVMPTATPATTSATSNANISSHSSGLSSGAAAGIGVSVGVAFIAVASLGIWLWRRKRRDDGSGESFQGHSPRGSAAGMMGNPAKSGVEMSVAAAEASWESDQSGRRRSTLMPIDPRIDPVHSGFYNRHENRSRDSINTLRDDQDYSRRVAQKVLRATNPDPD